MKKIFVGVLFSMILTGICNAQSLYSSQNLSQASGDTLELLHKRATELRTTGLLLSSLGTGAVIGGYFIISGSSLFPAESQFYTGIVVFIAGSAAILTGIPILTIGFSRVKRVKSYMPGLTNMSSAKLTPCTINLNSGNQVCPGIKFTVNF